MESAIVWQRLPYCGSPPDPSGLLARWNLDPFLILVILALAAVYWLGMKRAGTVSRPRMLAFYAGWGLGALALVSPLCPLSVSLFSARVGQHMILTLAAAPLVALGRPDIALAGWFARARVSPSGPAHMHGAAAAFAYAALLWLWHAPQPYALTFESAPIYWAMHISLIGSAVWLWLALVRGFEARGFKVAVIALASSIQMGFLGALITLAPRAVYAPHALTTVAWGLTPLQDQQLGGAIMWIPGCVLFLGVAIAAFGGLIHRLDKEHAGAAQAPSAAGA